MHESTRNTHNNLLKLFQFVFSVESTYAFFLDYSLIMFAWNIFVAAWLGRGFSDPHGFRYDSPASAPHILGVTERFLKAAAVSLPCIAAHIFLYDFPLFFSAMDRSLEDFAQETASVTARVASSSFVPVTVSVDSRVSLIWVLLVDMFKAQLAFLMLSVDTHDSAFSLSLNSSPSTARKSRGNHFFAVDASASSGSDHE